MEAVRKKIATLKDQVDEKDIRLDELTEEVKCKDKEIQEVQEDNDALKREVEKLKQQEGKLEDDRDEARERVKEVECELQNMERENASLRSQADALEEQLKQAGLRYDALKEEHDTTLSELREM